MIVIQEPYISTSKTGVRLCADIKYKMGSEVFYFEVPEEYGEYLCSEVSDAFLIGILNYAVAKGEDISVDGFISERLLYQLQTYFIPTLSVVRNKSYHTININARPYSGHIENAGAVGASASGGVDSYYTIVRHLNNVSGRYMLTHLLIANQFNYYKSEKETRKKFHQLIENSKGISENYGLKLIPMYTNHNEFLFDGFVQEYSLRICSYVFALQKLFSTYYVSSGVPYDSDGFDIFNLSLMTTDNLSFYSSGGEITRTQKILYFADDEYIQRNLKVCNKDVDHNCSECEKCMRTMLSLDIIGKLDKFKRSFDINKFKKYQMQYLITVESKTIEASKDLIESIEHYNYSVPFLAKVVGKSFKRFTWYMKEQVKRVEIFRKIYFLLKLDFFIYGKRQATIYRYGTEHEL